MQQCAAAVALSCPVIHIARLLTAIVSAVSRNRPLGCRTVDIVLVVL